MGGFSIWHWLVVLLVFGGLAGVVWLLVRAKTGNTGAGQTGAFRDPTALGKWTRWLVYALLALSVVGLFSSVVERSLLNDFKHGVYVSRVEATAAGEANDDRQNAIAVIQVIVHITSGVLILMWIYRANLNAHRLGVSGMEFSPGWSVGWYFVPFANLVKPYQVMRELWQTGTDPDDWKGKPVPSLIGWWWISWLAWNIIGNIDLRLSRGIHNVDDALVVNGLHIVYDALGVPVCLLLLYIMNYVQSKQMNIHAQNLVSVA